MTSASRYSRRARRMRARPQIATEWEAFSCARPLFSFLPTDAEEDRKILGGQRFPSRSAWLTARIMIQRFPSRSAWLIELLTRTLTQSTDFPP